MIELKELTLRIRDTLRMILSGNDEDNTTHSNSDIVDRYRDPDALLGELERFNRVDPQLGFQRFFRAVNRKRRRRVALRISAASAAAAVIAVSILTINLPRHTATDSLLYAGEPAADATVLLTGNSSFNVVSGDIVVNDNAIAVAGEKIAAETASADPLNQINTLITPQGRKQRIVLCDGTAVWLNAASKLTFPTRFGGDRRVVELEGEAFFDVSKSAAPFIVKTASTETKVLGTMFNISAYGDDAETELVLYEGSVALSTSSYAAKLSRREAVTANNSTGYITPPAPIAGNSPGWVSGMLDFRDVPLSRLCKALERWYGVDFEVDPRIAGHTMTILLSDKTPLAEILNLINETGGVRLVHEENGKILVVSQK